MSEFDPVSRAPIKHLELDGTHKKRLDKGRSRLFITIALFVAVYGVAGGKLVYLAMAKEPAPTAVKVQNDAIASVRPDILDRSGALLATDVKTPSLYAEPKKLIDIDEAAEQLAFVLPELKASELREKLGSGKGFVWLKREITPRQRADIHALGLPGIGFMDENRRAYPAGRTTSHIIGHVNVDNQGIAGFEKWIDTARGLNALHMAGFATDRAQEPVQISVDVRVQHALRDEMADAMQRYKAIAAGGIVMDAHTGEIIAMSSLPDYDPNDPKEALLPDRFNRLTTGTYEMGSTFKAFTLAMALDSGRFKMSDKVDARGGVPFGRHIIKDFHGQNRMLDLSEVFTYSSNIGTTRLAMAHGIEHHKEFLKRLGFFDRLRTELPESADPVYPKDWKPVNSATISFGHGISVAPLQAVAATAALMNGGWLMKPTFQKRSVGEARAQAVRVIKASTSEQMRTLFRANVDHGTARKSEVPGFMVGGKTGTAEKIENGRYAKEKLRTAFLAAFPTDEPKYIVLVMLDEPQKVPETHNVATAGMNAAPTAGRVIARIAPILNVKPRIDRLAGAQGVGLATN